MKNLIFALALVAMGCAGGGAYAQDAGNIDMNSSCALATQDFNNKDNTDIRLVTYVATIEWATLDAGRIKKHEAPFAEKLPPDAFNMMLSMVFVECGQNPKETLNQVADSIYNQALAASQSPSQ